MPSRLVKPLLHSSRPGREPLPLKIAYSHWESGPHLIRGSLVPPEPTPYRHLDQFSRFHEAHDCDRRTDRPTDYVTQSVTISRMYVALRRGLVIWTGAQPSARFHSWGSNSLV